MESNLRKMEDKKNSNAIKQLLLQNLTNKNKQKKPEVI